MLGNSELLHRSAGSGTPRRFSQPASVTGGDSATVRRASGSVTKPTLTIQKGDAVTHKRFGKGVVLAVTEMGSDALLEIAFDESGTRKLMRNSASAFMVKGP
jgi:DNA helicase-2/ATP-dependent DNA helicase PcrA